MKTEDNSLTPEVLAEWEAWEMRFVSLITADVVEVSGDDDE